MEKKYKVAHVQHFHKVVSSPCPPRSEFENDRLFIIDIWTLQ